MLRHSLDGLIESERGKKKRSFFLTFRQELYLKECDPAA